MSGQDEIMRTIMREQTRGKRKQGSAYTRKRQVDTLSYIIFALHTFPCNENKTNKHEYFHRQKASFTFTETIL